MSYAAKLAAMSRGHAPKAAPRVIGGEAEAPREEQVETDLRAPPAGPEARAAQPAAHRAAPVRREPEAPVRPDERARDDAEPERRITTELHTVERHEVVSSQALAEPVPPPPREPVRMPPAAQWLEEDRSASDALVAIAETDALRELMQRVRQWTTSAPTVIEAEKSAAPAAAPVPAPPAPEPSHVSIGNVVITVEDAPAPQPRGGRAPSSARTTTDRMARHHIRGG